MIKKDNLATQYWYKILALEKELSKALGKINKLEEDNNELRKENMELRIENENLKKMIFKGGKSLSNNA